MRAILMIIVIRQIDDKRNVVIQSDKLSSLFEFQTPYTELSQGNSSFRVSKKLLTWSNIVCIDDLFQFFFKITTNDNLCLIVFSLVIFSLREWKALFLVVTIVLIPVSLLYLALYVTTLLNEPIKPIDLFIFAVRRAIRTERCGIRLWLSS